MTDEPLTSRCFRCGGPSDELNELAEGENCPACAERLLETLQGVFHAPWGDPVARDEAQPETEADDSEERAVRGPRRAARGPYSSDDQGPRRA
jgi:hypothetical protein